MSLIPALLKVVRKFPEHITKVPEAFRARAAVDLADQAGAKMEEALANKAAWVKDSYAATVDQMDSTDLYDVPDPMGLFKVTHRFTPVGKFFYQKVSPTLKEWSNQFLDRPFHANIDYLNVPRTPTAQARIKTSLQSEMYRFGSRLTDVYNRMAQEALGKEVKGGGWLAGQTNRATAYLENLSGERTPGLPTWKEMQDEFYQALRMGDDTQIKNPHIRELTQEWRGIMNEYRVLNETSFNGKRPRLTPLKDYTDQDILLTAIEQGKRLPENEADQAALIKETRARLEQERSNYTPIIFDKEKVRADQLNAVKEIVGFYAKRANLKFRNPDTRRVISVMEEIDRQKVRIKYLAEETLTKEPGVSASAQDKGAFTAKQNQLTAEQEKLKRMESKLKKRVKSIREESQEQFEDRKAKELRRYETISNRSVDRIINSSAGYLDEVNRVSTSIPGKPKKTTGTGSRFLKQRRLTRHQEIQAALDKYLVKDPMTILHRYGQATRPGLVLDEMGSNFDDVLLRVRDDFMKAMEKETDPAKLETLGKEREGLEKDFEYVYNSLLHHNMQDPNLAGTRWSNRLMKFNNLILMNLVTISSLSDVGRVVMEVGGKRFADALHGMATQSPIIKGEMEYYSRIGSAADMVTANTLQSFSDITTGNSYGNWFDNALDWAVDKQGFITLFNPYQTSMKQVVSISTTGEWLDLGRQIKNGETPKFKNQLLNYRRAGLTDEDLVAMYDQWAANSQESFGSNKLARADKWQDKALAKKFEQAVVSNVDFVMTIPGVGDKSRIFNDPLGRALLQYKLFGIKASQSILLSGLQKADAMRLAGMFAMIGMGWVSYVARSAANGRDLSENPMDHLLEGIDRSGVLALGMDFDHILERATNGKLGLTPMLGGTQLSRFSNQDIWGMIGGPSVGTVSTAFKATGGVFDELVGEPGEFSYGDIRARSKMIPVLSQHFATSWAMRELEKGYANAYGIEIPQ